MREDRLQEKEMVEVGEEGKGGEKKEERWEEERRKSRTQPDLHSRVRGRFQLCWMAALSSWLPPWLRYLEGPPSREDEVDTPTSCLWM